MRSGMRKWKINSDNVKCIELQNRHLYDIILFYTPTYTDNELKVSDKSERNCVRTTKPYPGGLASVTLAAILELNSNISLHLLYIILILVPITDDYWIFKK